MGKMLIIIPDTENGENGELWGKWDGGKWGMGEWETENGKMGKMGNYAENGENQD